MSLGGTGSCFMEDKATLASDLSAMRILYRRSPGGRAFPGAMATPGGGHAWEKGSDKRLNPNTIYIFT
jgi:hypothetical protein